MPTDPKAALLASADDIETQFYEALQQADVDKLMAVWLDDDDIVCVHPGGPRVVGAAAIRGAFEAIFSNGPIGVRATKVRRIAGSGCAVHSVLETVELRTADGVQSAWVIATNVYLHTPAGWRMVAHHASPGTARELPEIGDPPVTLH